jgi:alpha-L-rhamnosidase
VGGSFTEAKGSTVTDYGTIESGWTAQDGVMHSYYAVVPANTTATLYLPISEEQAMALTLSEGMRFDGMEMHNGTSCAVFELLSGTYDIDIA